MKKLLTILVLLISFAGHAQISYISGTSQFCAGATVHFSNTTPGGTWSSSNTAIVTIGSTTGNATGVSGGSATITYMVGASYVTAALTVHSNPNVYTVTGNGSYCSNTLPGSSIGVGVPVSLSGSEIGVNYTLRSIEYSFTVPMSGTGSTLSFGSMIGTSHYYIQATKTLPYSYGTCVSMMHDTVTVVRNPTPPINVPSDVCTGGTMTLTDSLTGGTWSSQYPSIATIGATTGIVTGIVATNTNITYTAPTGCYAVTDVRVAPPPTVLLGSRNVCTGSPVTLGDPYGARGIFTSSNPAVVSIGTSGPMMGVSVGTATITFSLGGTPGCSVYATVTVNPMASYTGGSTNLCNGDTASYIGSPAGGSWSNAFTYPWATFTATAEVLRATGGVYTGGSYASNHMIYTAPGGCQTGMYVDIYPTPVITAPTSICAATTATLTATPAGGTWSTGTATIATVAPTTGVLSGITAGSSIITYAIPSGCSAKDTVTIIPPTCTGTPSGGTASSSLTSVCNGLPVTLSVTGASIACGIVYQWQRSTDGTSFTNISGATSLTYGFNPTNTAYYRCATTCTTTGLFSYSNIINVAVRNQIGTYHTYDSICNNPMFYISTCGTSTSYNVTTWFGDGTSSNVPLSTTGISYANITHLYKSPGTYTVRQVLYLGTIPQDSLKFIYENRACNTLPVRLYFDRNHNCAYDNGESSLRIPVQVRIDSNNIPIDTISATSGFYYRALGATGTVYSFRLISFPDALSLACPVGGIIRDTIVSATRLYTSKNFAMTCGTSSSFDLAQHVSSQAGRHAQSGSILVSNNSCMPQNADVTVHFNPRYHFQWSTPASVSHTDSTATWHLTSIAADSMAASMINYNLDMIGGDTWFVPNDTVHSLYTANMVVIDQNNSNNIIYKNDTVKASWDPNEISVSPQGYVLPCTQLQYTIRFENDGNDTARNISVMDTLSGNLDLNSLNVEIASAAMNIAIYKDGPYQIAKFDFPGINLPDSTHHGLNQGMVVFNINTKQGVTDGAVIPNQAGIYFDDNPAVMTNTIQNISGVSPITGTNNLCPTTTVALDNGTTGGTWTSSNISIATVGTSGVVSGISSGTATITYTASNTCGSRQATKSLTINPLPVISGSTGVCNGAATTLTSTTGGTWTSSNTAVATIGSGTGIVNSVSAGTTTISYTLSTGCSGSRILTINPMPTTITGSGTICSGNTLTLADATPAGTWSSSSTTVAPVSSTGIVTGGTAGTATISYTLSTGCAIATTVTVNPTPSAIAGTGALCNGSSYTFTNATPSGTWNSSNSSIASIGASTGIVTGAGAGAVTISYTSGAGCYTTTILTINPTPAAITGAGAVCSGNMLTLANATPAGTWTSSSTGIAPVSTTGVVTGAGAGIATISYTLGTGCMTTAIVTVNANPAAIAGTGALCNGASYTFTDATSAGTWNSNNTAIATIDASTGVVTGAGAGAGTATISYTLSTGCSTTTLLTINPLPATITGAGTACSGSTFTLSNTTPAGTWQSSDIAVATVNSTGVVTGASSGTATISYTLGTGCRTTSTITINPNPAAIAGAGTVCNSHTTTLANITPMGTWQSSNTGIATIGTTSGTVTGTGSGVVTISYILGTGCMTTTNLIVNPLPATIAGAGTVCNGATTTLTDATGSGTWQSSDLSVATVNPASGAVTGTGPGNATISYILPTGCMTTQNITVNPMPASITGASSLCAGSTSSLTNTVPMGTWASSNISIVTVDPSTGVTTGVGPGNATISYTLGTGCMTTTTMTINPTPSSITGTGAGCSGSTFTLSDPTPFGTWMSSDFSTATVDLTSGMVTGIAAGTATVSYVLGTGCLTTTTVTVNPLPATPAGAGSICSGATATLTDATLMGTWTSSNPSVATIGASSGIVTGTTAGTATISYTLGTGCMTTTAVVINPLPSTISGTATLCNGATSTLSDATSSGTWASSTPSIASVSPSSGIVTGMSSGTAIISYVLGTGCMATKVVTVNPQPTAYTVTGGGAYCAGATGVHIGLSGSATSTNYFLHRGTVITGPFAGTGSAMDMGLYTYAGTYTISATNIITTCSGDMTSSAEVDIKPSVTPSVSFTANPGVNVCTGTSVLLLPAAVNGGTAPVYNWNINGVDIGPGNAYTYFPVNGDIVKVTLLSNANCAVPNTASSSQVITVTDPGSINVSIGASPGLSLSAGQPVTFTASVAGATGALYYQWYINDMAMAGANSATFVTSTLSGGDVVKCAANTAAPCAVSTASSVTVQTNVSVQTVPTITNVSMFPNPNKGQFTLKGHVTSVADIDCEVTNMVGKVVYRHIAEVKYGSIDEQLTLPASLASGMYLLVLHTEGGNVVLHFTVDK